MMRRFGDFAVVESRQGGTPALHAVFRAALDDGAGRGQQLQALTMADRRVGRSEFQSTANREVHLHHSESALSDEKRRGVAQDAGFFQDLHSHAHTT